LQYIKIIQNYHVVLFSSFIFYSRSFTINKSIKTTNEKKHRLNQQITAREVRVLDVENEPLGIMSIEEALQLAADYEVDLVEIASTAQPPVCRLIDYGKFKYQEEKKNHDLKMKQKVVHLKEIKLRPVTDEGDYQVKKRAAIRFLEDGDKVKITIKYRGREITHQEFGQRLMYRFRDELGENIVIEMGPKLEGKQFIMVVAPAKKKVTKLVKPKEEKENKENQEVSNNINEVLENVA
jgi:translation initiation factor IF-3